MKFQRIKFWFYSHSVKPAVPVLSKVPRLLALCFVLIVLALVFFAYLQPEFILDLATRYQLC